MEKTGRPRVEIVVPVRNEEDDLGPNIRRLRAFLDDAFPFPAEVCIADNGSTDATWEIGALLARGSRVVRRPKRGGAISRGYNLLLRATLGVRFSDAQCGFKAIRRDVAVGLLPLVQDTSWFFDTELVAPPPTTSAASEQERAHDGDNQPSTLACWDARPSPSLG